MDTMTLQICMATQGLSIAGLAFLLISFMKRLSKYEKILIILMEKDLFNAFNATKNVLSDLKGIFDKKEDKS